MALDGAYTAAIPSDQGSGTSLSVTGLVDQAMEDLDETRSLSDGWDGYGAKAPSMHAISAAFDMLGLISKELSRDVTGQSPKVVAGPFLDGGVCIAIEGPEKWIEVTIANGGTNSIERSDGLESVLASPNALAAELSWLVA